MQEGLCVCVLFKYLQGVFTHVLLVVLLTHGFVYASIRKIHIFAINRDYSNKK